MHEHQARFTELLPDLISYMRVLHLDPVIGEVYRPPETAKLNALKGTGIANSLHCDKLAADILLFAKNDAGVWVLLDKTESYTLAGEYWKKLAPRCRWGGDFHKRPDGNHFSYTPDWERA